MTIVNWEKGRTQPSLKHFPNLIAFLGHVPFDCESDLLGRIRYYKTVHGLSLEALAHELRINESTVTGWLAGKHHPNAKSVEQIEAFLRTKVLPDPSLDPQHPDNE